MWFVVPLLVACTSPETEGPSKAAPLDDAPVDALGPHAVGTLAETIAGRSGVELVVQAWFPSKKAGSSAYRYDDLISGLATAGSPDCPGTRPVVLFSHGNSGLRYQNLFQVEWLASHGFVVLAPGHEGNTTFDNDEDRKVELMFRRPEDIADSFDAMTDHPDLAPCIDPDTGYAVMGHSFGGYTTFAVAGATLDFDASAAICAEADGWICGYLADYRTENPGTTADLSDDRVWAAVAMTPAGNALLDGGMKQIAVPTLVMGGDLDDLTPMDVDVDPAYRGLTSPRALAEIRGTGHYTYSEMCALLPVVPECGDPGFMDVDEAHDLISTVTTAFLERVLGREDVDDHLPPDHEAVIWEEVGD